MTLYVFGHPRSGTHYLGALVRANKFGPVSSKKLAGKSSLHRWPPPFTGEPLGEILDSEDNCFLYIWRNWSDVSLSFMAKAQPNRMVHFLTQSRFSSTSWESLVSEELIDTSLLKIWVEPDQRHMTPYESWVEHVKTWLDFADHRTDVYAVRYESLMNDFQSTVSDMARWLGQERDTYKNIGIKADSADVREGGFQGSIE